MGSPERIYRRLLTCLPAEFRAEAADELIDTFRHAHARVAGQGPVAGLRFWIRMLADLAVTSGAERFQRTRHDRVPIRSRDVMAFFNDFRIASRVLRHHPGFALTSVLTLALGIGAITAIYSVVHAVLLQPLPYRDPERLVLVWQELRARQVPEFPFPSGDVPDLRAQGTMFEDIAALSTGRQTVLSATNQPEQVRSAFVTTNTLGLLGLPIALGRDFQESDGTPPPPPPGPPAAAGGGPVPSAPAAQAVPQAPAPPPPPFMTILSHEYWVRRYGGDRAVIGQSIVTPGNATGQIVGVLAPGAELLFPPRNNIEKTPDFWIASRQDFAQASRTAGQVRVIGRLKPGVTIAQAQQQMDKLAADLRETYPVKKNAGVHINVVPMHESLVSDVRLSILALMGAVVFVLLIACANVANLMMTQAARRERELAVKTALGAGRATLVRQILAESLLLALAGSLVGLGLARVGIAALQRIGPQDLPRLAGVSIDVSVLGFCVGMALLSVLLFGLLPALRASRSTIVDVLRQSGRVAGLSSGRLRSGLVIAEVALSFVLLVGAGLMLRSLVALTRVDPGYDPNGVLTFLVTNIRGNVEARGEFTRRMREELARLPGVQGASAASPVPLDGRVANIPWGTEAAAADPTAFRQAVSYVVMPGYFEAMKSPAIDGRTFTEDDNSPDRQVII
ncbi:MAG TPA: ABC transporter permease, partial [Vicinamibacterales bacterium]|nr:ABC transporter permease [Vicinamibacterales bacterium]